MKIDAENTRRRAVLLQCANIIATAAALETTGEQARQGGIGADLLAHRLDGMAQIILQAVDLILMESRDDRVAWH